MEDIRAVPHARLRAAPGLMRARLHAERLPNRREVKGVPVAMEKL
jgi:hypothetical protein